MDVVTGGVCLHCQVDGPEGAPWVVFSNSLMTGLHLWDGQVEVLANRFRILRYDARGHGGSTVPSQDCTFDQLIEDLRTLLDHFSIARAAAVGVSMGGVTALGLAGRHPGRVSHAMICDCQPASTPAGASAWEERIGVARAGGMAALVDATIARWFRPETLAENPPALGRVRAMIAGTPLDAFIRAARALQDYDLRSVLGNISCPTTFLVGAQDAALPAAMQAMAASVPGAGFTSIAGCGHLPNIERPAEFNAALLAFLDAPPARS